MNNSENRQQLEEEYIKLSNGIIAMQRMKKIMRVGINTLKQVQENQQQELNKLIASLDEAETMIATMKESCTQITEKLNAME